MRTDPGALVSSALRAWCAGAAVLAVLTGAGALAGGWQLETGAAVCFVLCGAALWTPRWPLRSVAKLANAVAHEINNPLTVVGGNLQLLAAKIGERPELQRHFEHGERAVRRIAVMIDHMTRITRLEPLAGLDTGGVPTLDLRRSSDPDPG
ncbi:MAG: histidine kinase dimerization/phospho-acceptor domain-containing protein, partial [Candidatus Rokuibacteriota bacterium]